jgi:hypothetical protein
LVVALLSEGTLAFTKHAYEEMAKDNLTEIDVRNTLRGGAVRPGELARIIHQNGERDQAARGRSGRTPGSAARSVLDVRDE